MMAHFTPATNLCWKIRIWWTSILSSVFPFSPANVPPAQVAQASHGWPHQAGVQSLLPSCPPLQGALQFSPGYPEAPWSFQEHLCSLHQATNKEQAKMFIPIIGSWASPLSSCKTQSSLRLLHPMGDKGEINAKHTGKYIMWDSLLQPWEQEGQHNLCPYGLPSSPISKQPQPHYYEE